MAETNTILQSNYLPIKNKSKKKKRKRKVYSSVEIMAMTMMQITAGSVHLCHLVEVTRLGMNSPQEKNQSQGMETLSYHLHPLIQTCQFK